MVMKLVLDEMWKSLDVLLDWTETEYWSYLLGEFSLGPEAYINKYLPGH